VGWQLSKNLRTDLALEALEMGLWARQHAGRDTSGLILSPRIGDLRRTLSSSGVDQRVRRREIVRGERLDPLDRRFMDAWLKEWSTETVNGPTARWRRGVARRAVSVVHGGLTLSQVREGAEGLYNRACR
jgi:hypothetical protein